MLEKLRKIETDLDLIYATRHAENCGSRDDDVQVCTCHVWKAQRSLVSLREVLWQLMDDAQHSAVEAAIAERYGSAGEREGELRL